LEHKISGKTTLHGPVGIACDSKILYICGSHSNEILLFDKLNYELISQWKEIDSHVLGSINSIYFSFEQVYIGEEITLQIFSRESDEWKFLQCIYTDDDKFRTILGLCVVNETLYVCDWQGGRIRVFGSS